MGDVPNDVGLQTATLIQILEDDLEPLYRFRYVVLPPQGLYTQ